jgi:DnaJ-class molecular chaperone
VTNYYDLLGVARDASEAVIRQRFRVLARDLHPDRFTDPTRKSDAEAKFQILTEAVNVLTNEARRKAHDFDLNQGSDKGVHDPQAVAKAYLAKGVKAWREGDYLGAFSNFDMSVKHYDKDAKALHFLAQACLKVMGQARRGTEAIEAAIKLEPMNGIFHRDAAKLYMMAGLTAKAERHLDEALKWIPDDAEAARLLAEIRGSGAESRGRLGGLFGRRG